MFVIEMAEGDDLYSASEVYARAYFESHPDCVRLIDMTGRKPVVLEDRIQEMALYMARNGYDC